LLSFFLSYFLFLLDLPSLFRPPFFPSFLPSASPSLQLMRAMNGQKNIVECSYVQSDIVPNVPFFSSPIELGPNGVEKVRGLGKLTSYEEGLLQKAIPELQGSIKKGVEFANNFKSA
jgi:malate/lactate dehydrogenase